MRHALALLLASLALAPTTTSASPATGFPALADCSDLASAVGAELYVLKISATPTQRSHDWLWNVDQKMEDASDPQALLDPQGFWSVGDVWAVPQSDTDAAFAYVTYPAGELAADSSDGASVCR